MPVALVKFKRAKRRPINISQTGSLSMTVINPIKSLRRLFYTIPEYNQYEDCVDMTIH